MEGVNAEPVPEAWRSAVTDLPEALTLVLVWFATKEVRVAQYNPEAKKWGPPRIDRVLRVQPTHWQPLPAGPGGVAAVAIPSGPKGGGE